MLLSLLTERQYLKEGSNICINVEIPEWKGNLKNSEIDNRNIKNIKLKPINALSHKYYETKKLLFLLFQFGLLFLN